MASTRGSGAKRRAAWPAPEPVANTITQPDARLDQGAKLLALGRIMAELSRREEGPEREYLNGFIAGFEHALELAAMEPVAAERWRAWLLEVLHHGRADLAATLHQHAAQLAASAPRVL